MESTVAEILLSLLNEEESAKVKNLRESNYKEYLDLLITLADKYEEEIVGIYSRKFLTSYGDR